MAAPVVLNVLATVCTFTPAVAVAPSLATAATGVRTFNNVALPILNNAQNTIIATRLTINTVSMAIDFKYAYDEKDSELMKALVADWYQECKTDLTFLVLQAGITVGPKVIPKVAKTILEKAEGDEIFVFNSDVTCTFPRKKMLEFHRKHGKEGTIAVTKVKDPSRFGVILCDENRKILNFIEKPQTWVGDNINAGLYIFSKRFLKRVNPVPTSIEREIFPQMANEGELYSFLLEGFWADIGQPKDYLIGTELYLNNLKEVKSPLLSTKANIQGNVVIDPTATVDDTAVLGPNVIIGPGVTIKKGARIKNSVILADCVIGESSFISGSIIGWKSKIGKWVRIEGLSVFGEEVTIKDEVLVQGCIILPNVTIKANPKENAIILA